MVWHSLSFIYYILKFLFISSIPFLRWLMCFSLSPKSKLVSLPISTLTENINLSSNSEFQLVTLSNNRVPYNGPQHFLMPCFLGTEVLDAAAAKCDPIDGSPPGSPVPWMMSFCLLFLCYCYLHKSIFVSSSDLFVPHYPTLTSLALIMGWSLQASSCLEMFSPDWLTAQPYIAGQTH